MRLIPGALGGCCVLLAFFLPAVCLALDQDQLKLFNDPQGWEYIAIFDHDNGVQMQHQCFVEGSPGTGACRGMLFLPPDGHFTQTVTVHGSTLERHGTYELDDDQLTFQDELGTKDGPYTVDLKTDEKSMRISMRQSGVLIGAALKLKNQSKKKESDKQKTPDYQ
jgi:hypothetical protein